MFITVIYNKNAELGRKIHQLLLSKGVESPALFTPKTQDDEQLVQQKLTEFLQLLGLDLANASIADTPKRISKFFLHELFYGLNYANFPYIIICSIE